MLSHLKIYEKVIIFGGFVVAFILPVTTIFILIYGLSIKVAFFIALGEFVWF